tara:strand:- start:243 stop:392 length:150 start_codon:yes stop_codon:yes gene_type:complete
MELKKDALTNQAKRAKMTIKDFSKMVKKNPKKFTEKTRKRVQFYLNFNK